MFHQAGFVLGRLGFDAKAFREERYQAAVALVDRLAIFVSLFRQRDVSVVGLADQIVLLEHRNRLVDGSSRHVQLA